MCEEGGIVVRQESNLFSTLRDYICHCCMVYPCVRSCLDLMVITTTLISDFIIPEENREPS